MNRWLGLGALVLGGVMVARRLGLSERRAPGRGRGETRRAGMMARMMARMPPDSPPKLIMSILPRLREQNEEILALLREQNELLRRGGLEPTTRAVPPLP